MIEFSLGERVYIDSDQNITARIVAIICRPGFQECECQWFSGGSIQSAMVGMWRLTPAESKR